MLLHVNDVEFLVNGHQGEQAKKTCSNVFLPVALDNRSYKFIDQSEALI